MVSIRQKTSTVAGKAPLPADLERGELAVNLADKKLFTKDQTDAIIELGGGGEYVPDLKDVTIAATPYDESTDGSGYLTRIGGKTAGDADEYQITRVNLAAGDTAPANPHAGMTWVDTTTMKQYTWDGTKWIVFGDYVPPGTQVVQYDVAADPATPVQVVVQSTGHTDPDCFVDWGDGTKDAFAGSLTFNHTYPATREYNIRFVMNDAATFDGGGGWPTVTGGRLVKVGPCSDNLKVNKYGWGATGVTEIDMTGVAPLQLTSAAGLFKDRAQLMPDKVKGVDPAKISDISALMENRRDIKGLSNAWMTWPEATGVNNAFKNSGIKEIIGFSAPKATIAIEFVAGTRLESLSASLPAATDVDQFMQDATIDQLEGVDLSSVIKAEYFADGAHIKEVTTGFTINQDITVSYFATNKPFRVDGYTNDSSRLFTGTGRWKSRLNAKGRWWIIGAIRGMKVLASMGIFAQDAGKQSNFTELWDMEIDNTLNNDCRHVWNDAPPELGFRDFSSLTRFWVRIKGPARAAIYGAIWPFLLNRPEDTFEHVGPNMFDEAASFESYDRTQFGTGRTLKEPIGTHDFRALSLTEESVDNLLTSWATFQALNDPPAAPDQGPFTIDLAGGKNAAPSATGTAAATALTAAGWTVTTN